MIQQFWSSIYFILYYFCSYSSHNATQQPPTRSGNFVHSWLCFWSCHLRRVPETPPVCLWERLKIPVMWTSAPFLVQESVLSRASLTCVKKSSVTACWWSGPAAQVGNHRSKLRETCKISEFQWQSLKAVSVLSNPSMLWLFHTSLNLKKTSFLLEFSRWLWKPFKRTLLNPRWVAECPEEQWPSVGACEL